MAITKISGPSNWGRASDTNRLTYKFSSDKYQQPNFQFQIVLRVYDCNNTPTILGKYNLYPLSGGTCEFNPAQIYRNYLSYDFNASTTAMEEAVNTAKEFQICVYDFYGSPAKVEGAGNYCESPRLILYNGCQQNIPYDYMALNAPLANMQWVMDSGNTSGGTFLTDANRYELDNDSQGFLYFLADKASRPTKIKYTIYYQNTTTSAEGLNLPSNYNIYNTSELLNQSFPQGTQTDLQVGSNTYLAVPPVPLAEPSNSVTVYDTNVNYVYDYSRAYYFPIGPKQLINNSIIPSGITNKWTYYRVDICNNYSYDDYCYSNTIAAPLLMPIGSAIYEAQNEDVFALLTSGGTVLDEDVTHPGTGPWQHRSGPIYYSKTASGTTVINRQPFFVYKKNKCDKYEKWQLFWLNPNGGFDTFVFDKIKDIDYKIERTTYKQRLPTASYSTYDAGEKVFNIDVEEVVTLRTGNITQLESQLIIQLIQSPVVYVMRSYYYNDAFYDYGVPYIVVTDSVRYEQKKNSKEIFYELKIRPANQKIIQRD